MKPFILIAVLACSLPGIAQSQDNKQWPWHLQLNLQGQAGLPIEAFADELDTEGFGFGGLMAFQLGRGRPLFAGLEASALYLDRENLEFTSVENGETFNLRLNTRNNIFLGHAFIRYKPFFDSYVQPYVDGLLGFKYLYTRTRLIDETFEEEEVLEGDTYLGDWAFSYGLAGGLQVFITSNPVVMADLRIAYLPGENAAYYRRMAERPDVIEDPLDVFEEASSPTSMLLIQLGVTVQLSDRDFEAAPKDGG